MAKVNKSKGIEIILKELDKGIDRASCLAIFNENWQTPIRTFDRWWKEANRIQLENQSITSTALMNIKLENEKELLKTTINDKNEQAVKIQQLIKQLGKIKAGKVIYIENEKIIASFSDEIRAKGEIRQLYKMLGDWYGFNAPLNSNIINTEITPIKRVFRIERIERKRGNPLNDKI